MRKAGFWSLSWQYLPESLKMMIIILAFLFYLILQEKRGFFWLVVPVGFWLDLWKRESFGLNGLKILLLVWLLNFFLEKRGKSDWKLR